MCKTTPSVVTIRNRSVTVDFKLVLLLSGSRFVGNGADVLSVVQRRQRGQNQQRAVLQDGHAGLVTRQFLAITQPPDHWLRKT